MAEDKKTTRAPMRRGLRALLIGSLAVNLIVAGLALGAVLGNSKGGNRPPRDADFMGAYTRALPDEDRRAIGRAIRDHHRKSGISREAARAEFEAMINLLRAIPFDASKVKAGLEQQAKAGFERRASAQTMWLERVTVMTDAERQDYADRIQTLLARKPKGPEGRK